MTLPPKLHSKALSKAEWPSKKHSSVCIFEQVFYNYIYRASILNGISSTIIVTILLLSSGIYFSDIKILAEN